jgi:hypothetical protein
MSKIVTKKKAAGGKPITAWSFSRLGVYEQCPFKFKLVYVDGLKEPGSAAMDRGKAIHAEGEAYLKNADAALPDSYKLLAVEMEELRASKALSELEITFTADWGPTGWFDDNAWLRIKIDALLEKDGKVQIIDFKTGKNRGGYEDQLELYALAALIMYPDAKEISAELWFLDSGEIIGTSHGAYSHTDVNDLKKKWLQRSNKMFIDTLWSPRANQYCRWCHFRKENNGPCQY